MKPKTPMPKVSVIVLSYNKALYISETLNNLLFQQASLEEILIIDDCSSDGSQNLIKNFAKSSKKISAILNKNNTGIIANLNLGLKLAKGTHIMFLGAEDQLYKNFFKKTLCHYENNPDIAMCCTKYDLINENSEVIGRRPWFELTNKPEFISPDRFCAALQTGENWLSTTTIIFQKCLLVNFGGFDPKLLSFCDGYLSRLIAASHGFFYIPEILAAYRHEENSYSKKTTLNKNSNNQILIRIAEKLQVDVGGERLFFYLPLLRRRFDFYQANISMRSKTTDTFSKFPFSESSKSVLYLNKLIFLVCICLNILRFRPYPFFSLFNNLINKLRHR